MDTCKSTRSRTHRSTKREKKRGGNGTAKKKKQKKPALTLPAPPPTEPLEIPPGPVFALPSAGVSLVPDATGNKTQGRGKSQSGETLETDTATWRALKKTAAAMLLSGEQNAGPLADPPDPPDPQETVPHGLGAVTTPAAAEKEEDEAGAWSLPVPGAHSCVAEDDGGVGAADEQQQPQTREQSNTEDFKNKEKCPEVGLLALPVEVHWRIKQFLNAAECACVARTCTRLYRIYAFDETVRPTDQNADTPGTREAAWFAPTLADTPASTVSIESHAPPPADFVQELGARLRIVAATARYTDGGVQVRDDSDVDDSCTEEFSGGLQYFSDWEDEHLFSADVAKRPRPPALEPAVRASCRPLHTPAEGVLDAPASASSLWPKFVVPSSSESSDGYYFPPHDDDNTDLRATAAPEPCAGFLYSLLRDAAGYKSLAGQRCGACGRDHRGPDEPLFAPYGTKPAPIFDDEPAAERNDNSSDSSDSSCTFAGARAPGDRFYAGNEVSSSLVTAIVPSSCRSSVKGGGSTVRRHHRDASSTGTLKNKTSTWPARFYDKQEEEEDGSAANGGGGTAARYKDSLLEFLEGTSALSCTLYADFQQRQQLGPGAARMSRRLRGRRNAESLNERAAYRTKERLGKRDTKGSLKRPRKTSAAAALLAANSSTLAALFQPQKTSLDVQAVESANHGLEHQTTELPQAAPVAGTGDTGPPAYSSAMDTEDSDLVYDADADSEFSSLEDEETVTSQFLENLAASSSLRAQQQQQQADAGSLRVLPTAATAPATVPLASPDDDKLVYTKIDAATSPHDILAACDGEPLLLCPELDVYWGPDSASHKDVLSTASAGIAALLDFGWFQNAAEDAAAPPRSILKAPTVRFTRAAKSVAAATQASSGGCAGDAACTGRACTAAHAVHFSSPVSMRFSEVEEDSDGSELRSLTVARPAEFCASGSDASSGASTTALDEEDEETAGSATSGLSAEQKQQLRDGAAVVNASSPLLKLASFLSRLKVAGGRSRSDEKEEEKSASAQSAETGAKGSPAWTPQQKAQSQLVVFEDYDSLFRSYEVETASCISGSQAFGNCDEELNDTTENEEEGDSDMDICSHFGNIEDDTDDKICSAVEEKQECGSQSGNVTQLKQEEGQSSAATFESVELLSPQDEEDARGSKSGGGGGSLISLNNLVRYSRVVESLASWTFRRGSTKRTTPKAGDAAAALEQMFVPEPAGSDSNGSASLSASAEWKEKGSGGGYGSLVAAPDTSQRKVQLSRKKAQARRGPKPAQNSTPSSAQLQQQQSQISSTREDMQTGNTPSPGWKMHSAGRDGGSGGIRTNYYPGVPWYTSVSDSLGGRFWGGQAGSGLGTGDGAKGPLIQKAQEDEEEEEGFDGTFRGSVGKQKMAAPESGALQPPMSPVMFDSLHSTRKRAPFAKRVTSYDSISSGGGDDSAKPSLFSFMSKGVPL